MQVYLDDNKDDFKTKFIRFICGYLEIEERKLGTIIYANNKTKQTFSFPGLPFYIPPPESKEEPIHTDEIEIAKGICREAKFEKQFFGKINSDTESINKFLEHIRKDLNYDVQKLLPELNENLKFSTFINDYYSITILDLFCFCLIVNEFNQMDDKMKQKYCNVSRWACYIQGLQCIEKVCKTSKMWFSLPYTPFILDLEQFMNTGKKEKKNEDEEKIDEKKEEKKENKKKEEKKKEEKRDDKKEDKKEGKKEKKEKNKQQQQNQDVHPMTKVDIRVGKVIAIEPNQEGEKLYNEQIDFGNGEIRKIASGLRGRVDINDLKDSLVVCILNLEEKMLKGWPSHGMILCASTKDGKIEPIRPPEGSNIGDLVYIGDLPREPVPDKKCHWKKVADKLFVNDKKEATYKNGEEVLIWKTDKGIVGTKTLTDAIIS